MLHVYCPINHRGVRSYRYEWYFTFLIIGNWIEQSWRPHIELQILALGYVCQSRQARGNSPVHGSVPVGHSPCLCWFFQRWALLPHGCPPPLLPLTSVGGCGGYHTDLKITIKDFLGKCQVWPWHELTTAIWPGLCVIIATSWATYIRPSWSRRS